jgi:putative ABC transport system substrate-binding protein
MAVAIALIYCMLCMPPAVGADTPKKTYRIGALNGSTQAQTQHMFAAFREGLREQGFVEGQNLTIEYRWAEGKLERFPGMAEELVKLNVDVIFAPPTPSAVAAHAATKTIPIVFALAADPVGSGLVGSLARPGGNVTGLSTINVELGPKRLELLKEAFPKIKRVAVLHNPDDNSNQLQLKISQEAAKALGIVLVPVGVRRREDIDAAFATVAKERADAIFVMENPVNFTVRKTLVSLVQQNRLPAIYALREFVDDGGLMAYAVNTPDQFRRAAAYVARILKGAKPADLPVEQPTRVDLVINLKAAKAEGHAIPQSLLLRADEVIR